MVYGVITSPDINAVIWLTATVSLLAMAGLDTLISSMIILVAAVAVDTAPSDNAALVKRPGIAIDPNDSLLSDNSNVVVMSVVLASTFSVAHVSVTNVVV